jgi:hypothetical protein
MKKSESIFLEIIKYVMENKNNSIDNSEINSVHTVNYYKTHFLGNTCSYVYTSEIMIDEENGISLHFYFSNKRSYLALHKDNMTDLDFSRFQYYLLIYSEKLFFKYHLYDFIYGLNDKGL